MWVELLELIHEHEATFWFQSANDSSGHAELIGSRHAVPGVAVIDKLAPLDRKAIKGQLRVCEERHLVFANAFDLAREILILIFKFVSILHGHGADSVRANLRVRLVDRGDGCFDLCCGFVLKFFSGFLCRRKFFTKPIDVCVLVRELFG